MAATATLPAPTIEPMVIGHRGMGRSHFAKGNPFTENTRQSYLAAHAAGAAWVELDVLPSADGDLFLHHDHFVRRRPIWTYSTLELLDAGLELLDGLCADLPPTLGLDIEIKAVPGDVHPSLGPPALSKVIEWAHAHAGHHPVVITSFDPFVAATAHQAGLRAGWITRTRHPLFEVVTAAGAAGLNLVMVHGSTLESRPEYEFKVGLDIAGRLGITIWTYDCKVRNVPVLAARGVRAFCVDDVADAVTALSRPTPTSLTLGRRMRA